MARKAKVTGTADYIIPLGVVGILGLIAYKYLGGAPGTSGASGSDNKDLTAASGAAAAATMAAQKAKGEMATLSAVQAQGIASSIFALGLNDPPDTYGILNSLIQVNNLTDLTLIIQYFGTKQVNNSGWFSTCALMNFNCQAMDLPAFIRVVYANDPTDLATINQYFQDAGINYSF